MREPRRSIGPGIVGVLACAALVLALPVAAGAKQVTYTGKGKGPNGIVVENIIIVEVRNDEPVKILRYRIQTLGECPGGLPWPFEFSGPSISGGLRIKKNGGFTDNSTNGGAPGSRVTRTVKGTVSPNGKQITGTVGGTIPVGGAQCTAKGIPFKVQK